MKHLRILAGILTGLAIVLSLGGGPAAWAEAARVWPVSGPVVRGFDPPSVTWGAGHRGIDIGAPAGSTVVAPDDGLVTFAGVIDYVPILTLAHADGTRTTYQPVSAAVRQGERVGAGQPIGILQAGHGTAPCLHFGVKLGEAYRDPLAWLGAATRPVRLLPGGSVVPPRATTALVGAPDGWPVTGRVTSGYGWRTHPISGRQSFHNGIDIGAACGTPVATPWPGVVSQIGYTAVLGNYVRVAHADELVTTYQHLSAISVVLGDQLTGGQQIGLVGTTGMSTGCHLHFVTARGTATFDPRSLLP